MAASMAKRQFGHPPPIAGRAPESPARGFGFSPFVSANDYRDDYNSDDDDDDETDPWWKPLCISSGGGIGLEPSIRDPRDVGTSDSWVERNPSLIRLTGKHPFNSEPPLASLMAHGFITPSPLHYVRNHGAVPRAEWSTWTVDITGLVRSPLRLSMDQLVNGFPALEIPVTLVCAGNRRKEQNMSRQTVGFNWGSAAVSTSIWRGARLRDVLRRCGVTRHGAYVSFEGAEDLPGGGGSKYGTSLRREAAMDPSNDVMLAYMQNGELLSPDHGFPVRLIIPGFIGGRMVKWLKRVIVTADESDSHYHYRDNRVLPPHVVDADLANSEAWWYKPEYIINELNINSVITSPSHDEILPINSFTTQRPYTMKGYAYSGGGKKVTRVEITLDGGDTWRVCSIDHPERPNKYGKYWCWCFWSVELEVLDLLGTKEIAVRAWDSTHNTQPEKLIWNLMGMMNNCWFRVRVNVCRPHQGEVGLVFEHPTQPGNLDGGWMARQKEPPSLKKSLSSPLMNTSATDSRHSMSEVQRHATRDSAWIVVNGHVYDCTSFIKDHPGGADSILINAGTDCTEEFEAIHSNRAKSMLDTYLIGELIPDARLDTIHEAPTTGIKPLVDIALSNPRERVPIRLVAKTAVSRVVRRFRFALPSAHNLLGLPVGKHIFLCASIDGKLCMRAYTPTSPVDEVGHLDLLVKVYLKGENPRFPEGGLMSQHLDSLPLGAPLEIKGPIGHIEYAGRGNFLIDGKTRFARRLAMIAGGTGITPVWQVIQAVMRDQPEDRTEMHVVYANQTEDDVLLREELDRCVGESHGRLRVWYVVSKPRQPQEWPYGVGSVNEAVLREHVMLGGDDETLAFACGPPGLIQSAVLPNLEKMGYDVAKSCFLF